MIDDKKILVGKIVAPQGVRGEIRVQTYTSDPMDLAHIPVFGANISVGDVRVIRRLNPTSSVVVARINGINDRNAAETLRGVELFITRDALPATDDGEYYQADLIGFTVVRGDVVLGVLDGFQNFGAGDIMELDNGDMVSFRGVDVDMGNKTIKVM